MGNSRALVAFSTWIVLSTAFVVPATDVVAAPYEIPADWKRRPDSTWPAGVAGAFRGIEHVRGLGIVAYGDELLLRLSDDKPFVTLGVRASAGADNAYAYVGSAPLGTEERMLVRTRAERSGDSLVRQSDLVRWNLDERSETPLPFPSASYGAPWSVIRLFQAPGGALLAYAGRAEPLTFPLRFDRVSRAAEQRFFRRSDSGAWAPLALLDPARVSATAACTLGDTLLVAGTHLELAEDGTVKVRRPASAVLDGEIWSDVEIEAAPDVAAHDVDALACTDGSAYLLGVVAGSGQSPQSTFLTGAPTLHRYAEGAWRRMELPATAANTAVTALALDTTGAPWVAIGATLHRFEGGRWTKSAGAALPSGAVIEGIAFDDAGAGWAVANSPGDAEAPKARGFLLRFDAAACELHGVTWSPLRQRGFGLFGATD